MGFNIKRNWLNVCSKSECTFSERRKKWKIRVMLTLNPIEAYNHSREMKRQAIWSSQVELTLKK